MAHWKHTATRCAVEGCEETRRKGWTTCPYRGHAALGVSLYGLAPKAPRLADVSEPGRPGNDEPDERHDYSA